MLHYQTGQLLNATETNINERVKYTANTGVVIVDTANTNTDGTGTLGTVITGASNGTLIHTITVKGIATDTPGMVRLFIYDGTSVTALIDEIDILAVTQSSIQQAFEVCYDVDISLKSGWSLKASTQTGDDFIIIAEGLDYAYP